MKEDRLLNVLSNVDSKYIEEADPEVHAKVKTPIWIKGVAIAACACLILGSILFLFSQNKKPSMDTPKLPVLTLPENNEEDMGYEGYMAYDISELTNGNPWHEGVALKTLPVYKNTLTNDENGIAAGADWDKMEKMLYDVAARLGIKKEELTVTDDTPDEEEQVRIKEKFNAVEQEIPKGYFEPTMLIGRANGIVIRVSQTMTASVEFQPSVELPADYSFSNYCSYEDMLLSAEYLKVKYKNLIDMDKPIADICSGDYDIYKRQHFNLNFFDGSGDQTEQIINYNFCTVSFYPDDNGQLCMASVSERDLSQKVGDYPIISADDAKKLLSNGNYTTTVPYELPGMEYVKKVELIYRHDIHDEYYIPYYRFLVELPKEKQENDMKTYGAYYVPAVKEAYISNMPLWDGNFN